MIKKLLFFLLPAIAAVFACSPQAEDTRFVSYIATPGKIQMWKGGKAPLGSIAGLMHRLGQQDETLIFAMNGGMYREDYEPLGIYIENNILISPLDTLEGKGNFYLKPNGVFSISNSGTAAITPTQNFNLKDVTFATQSGPMLLVDGNIHDGFSKTSENLQIRNGVGILPTGDVVFAMSKQPINFYDFAMYFKNNGCKTALYLDGFV